MATPQKKEGSSFTWFDKAASVSTNENGEVTSSPARKGALSIIGTTLQGVAAPFAGDMNFAQRQQQIDEQRQRENDVFTAKLLADAKKQTEERLKASDPETVLKKFEATSKINALVKQQRGEPLSDFDKTVIGYKDPNSKPSDMELYRQAYSTAVTKLGGSSMVGLSPDKSASLNSETQNEYLNLKKQFGTETPEEKLQRAKLWLKQNGYTASNETASMLLKQNENF